MIKKFIFFGILLQLNNIFLKIQEDAEISSFIDDMMKELKNESNIFKDEIYRKINLRKSNDEIIQEINTIISYNSELNNKSISYLLMHYCGKYKNIKEFNQCFSSEKIHTQNTYHQAILNLIQIIRIEERLKSELINIYF